MHFKFLNLNLIFYKIYTLPEKKNYADITKLPYRV